jgi:hypothetical protein
VLCEAVEWTELEWSGHSSGAASRYSSASGSGLLREAVVRCTPQTEFMAQFIGGTLL